MFSGKQLMGLGLDPCRNMRVFARTSCNRQNAFSRQRFGSVWSSADTVQARSPHFTDLLVSWQPAATAQCQPLLPEHNTPDVGQGIAHSTGAPEGRDRSTTYTTVTPLPCQLITPGSSGKSRACLCRQLTTRPQLGLLNMQNKVLQSHCARLQPASGRTQQT